MPKVRLNYDGWLALPADVRKKLGLATGYQLELELVGGALARPPVGPACPAPTELTAARPPSQALPPAPAAVPEPPVKRGPGRPRKVPAVVALSPGLKARGARRKATSLEGTR